MKNTKMQVFGGLLDLALALAAPVASAQSPFDGTWQAVGSVNGQRTVIQLVMNAGRYRETVQCGSLMTMQAGTYSVFGNTLVRTVYDWEPKQRYVVDVRRNGLGGHYEINAKPPGGSFRVTFNSPDSMFWQDVNFGGTITFQRVR